MTRRTTDLRHPPGQAPRSWMWVVLGAAPLLALAALILLLLQRDGDENASGSQPTATATVGAILAGPEPFLNDTVVVSGTIDQVVSDRVFTIRDVEQPDHGALLVVLTTAEAGGEPPSLDPSVAVDRSSELRVTGTVRRFDLTQVEPEAGIDLDEGTAQPYEGRPVILADRFERAGS